MHPTLEEITLSCGQALFTHYGLAVDVEPLARKDATLGRYAGLIGFAGDPIKGSLIVSANEAAIRATSPGEVEDVGFCQDWIGELCNQYLGRAINKISAFGTTIRMATPVAIRGDNMALGDQQDAQVGAWRLSAGDASFVVIMTAEVDPAFQWEVPPDADEAPDEGDLMLF